ncbi:MAG: hypothetical protein H8D34_22685 [Chloroflexi bacterium]|nr:hypothetical protein [Chloroflexota bacterium]
MVDDIYSAANILAALNQIENQLLSLIAPSWADASNYKAHKVDLADEETEELAALGIIELFAPHAIAFKLLNTAIIKQNDWGAISLMMAELTRQIKPELSQAFAEAALPESTIRKVAFKRGDPSSAKSFKLGNIDLDLGEMHTLLLGILTVVGNQIVGEEIKPFFVALGIIAIAKQIIDSMALEIDDREATVLWGFAKIADENRIGSELDILNATNRTREMIGLRLLNDKEIRNSLHNLQTLRIIEKSDSEDKVWKIKESIQRKNMSSS